MSKPNQTPRENCLLRIEYFLSMEKSLSEDEKLWQNLKIKFRLEGSAFPDNKIFGIIDVEPESARRLIKQFEVSIF